MASQKELSLSKNTMILKERKQLIYRSNQMYLSGYLRFGPNKFDHANFWKKAYFSLTCDGNRNFIYLLRYLFNQF